MRLSKRIWLVIGIGIFVITSVALGMVRFQLANQQAQLNNELTSSLLRFKEVQLEQLSFQQAQLEEQLSQTKSQFEAVSSTLSQSVWSVAASNALFNIAKAHSLEVTEITSSGPATTKLEGVTCSVWSLTVKVGGNVPNLVSFITKLKSHFANGVVSSITITIPEKNGAEKASADIKLAVYTYQGG